MADYANDVLVEPEWLEQHLNDDSIRIVEVDENPALYREAHIPGAIGFDWRLDLQDQVKRDFLGPEEFGALFGSRGISGDHQVILYGDRNNWFAAYTYWYLKYYGHNNVKLLDLRFTDLPGRRHSVKDRHEATPRWSASASRPLQHSAGRRVAPFPLTLISGAELAWRLQRSRSGRVGVCWRRSRPPDGSARKAAHEQHVGQ